MPTTLRLLTIFLTTAAFAAANLESLLQLERENASKYHHPRAADKIEAEKLAASSHTKFLQADSSCPICLEAPTSGQPIFIPGCGHFTHYGCQWNTPAEQRGQCKVCRVPFEDGRAATVGRSMRFLPTAEDDKKTLAAQLAKLLTKIATAPQSICDNAPAALRPWTCFGTTRRIQVTRAVLSLAIPDVPGASVGECLHQPKVSNKYLSATILLPPGSAWGSIGVNVQCLWENTLRGFMQLKHLPATRPVNRYVPKRKLTRFNHINMILPGVKEQEEAVAKDLVKPVLMELKQVGLYRQYRPVQLGGREGHFLSSDRRLMSTLNVVQAIGPVLSAALPKGYNFEGCTSPAQLHIAQFHDAPLRSMCTFSRVNQPQRFIAVFEVTDIKHPGAL